MFVLQLIISKFADQNDHKKYNKSFYNVLDEVKMLSVIIKAQIKVTYSSEVKMNPFPEEWVHQLHLEHFRYSCPMMERLCLILIASKALPSGPFQCEDT